MRIFYKYGIFFLVPGLVLACSIFLKMASGPYWLGMNSDPSYPYLINGLNIGKGTVPNMVEHPGTPLQILCWLVIGLFNIGRSLPDIVNRALTSPEFYLQAVSVTLLLLSFLTSIALAVYVYRNTKDKAAAVLTQLPALIFLTLKSFSATQAVLPVVANVSPEPMLISILNLFNLCLFKLFFSKTSRQESVAAILLGFVGGLGVAVKFNFMLVLAVPLIVLCWRKKFLFAGVCAAAFFIGTLPLLSSYPSMWKWFYNLITHSGKYGTGPSGMIEIHSYIANGKLIVGEQWFFLCILLLALIVGLLKFAKKGSDRGVVFLLAVSVAILFQFALVAKHPSAHYLLPGFGLFSALLVFLYFQWPVYNVLYQRVVVVLIVIFIFAGVWRAGAYRAQLASLTRDSLTFHERVREKYKDCIFLGYYRSSGQATALSFGDGWNGSSHFGDELMQVYPNSAFFHVWTKRIQDFNGQSLWSNDLLERNSCVLFQGGEVFDFSKSPYTVRLLEQGNLESIKLLTMTTEKQAAIIFSMAVQAFKAGDRQKALGLALKAREFHYQPAESVDALIKLVASNL